MISAYLSFSEIACLCNFFIYSVEDVLTDDANFGFARIDESASRIVCKICGLSVLRMSLTGH